MLTTEGKNQTSQTIKQYKAMKTIAQFRSESKQLGFNRVRQFTNISNFMNFCYRGKLTQENSIAYIRPDGSGCFLAY